MTEQIFKLPKTFTDKKSKKHITIEIVSEGDFTTWIRKQDKSLKTKADNLGFAGKAEQVLVIRDGNENAKRVIAGISAQYTGTDFATVAQAIGTKFSDKALKETSFEFSGLKTKHLVSAYIGWGLAAYRFERYKKSKSTPPALLWTKDADKKRIKTFVEAICGLRDLVNTPANDLGPDELEAAAKDLAKNHEAKITVTRGEKLEKGFPLIHTVGMGSERKPRLIDIKWGNSKHPKVTLVGKGVCFDTGGLNLKPTSSMALMKKDMGGAAHVLALGHMIMALKLPVRLRILIPAVENSVSGNAFRPGDIIKSRKGLTVENTNTDAEGRLILADTLTYASEEKTDLIIDYATLTGSARAALGPDIPAGFSNADKLRKQIPQISEAAEDLIWMMPLWQSYQKYIKSPDADLLNSASVPGDLIYSALFLEQFLTGKPDWIHLDVFAWEQSGKPGRPKGAADTGLRGIFALLEDMYRK